jgi:hypothetical protein
MHFLAQFQVRPEERNPSPAMALSGSVPARTAPLVTGRMASAASRLSSRPAAWSRHATLPAPRIPAMQPLDIRNGSFYRDGRRIFPTGPVYFGRVPGTCGGNWFGEESWKANEAHLDRDFALMRQVGMTWCVPFVNMAPFFRDGKPVEAMFDRMTRMVELARRNDFYLIASNSPGPAWCATAGRR